MTTNNYFAPALAELRRQRRLMGNKSPEQFARIYLAHHCTLSFSRMHKEMFAALAEMEQKRSGRLAIAAPRGHAKSTIASLAFVLWSVLYEKEKLVLLVSATKEQAELLLSAIKDELQKNALLLTDFPEICRPEWTPRQPKPWRRNRIRLPNGAMISAYGAGQGIRGAKNVSDRPGLIVVDDVEDPEQVISEEQREKLSVWFKNTLLHAGHPETNVIVVGTVLHHDSLLARLINPDDRRGWQSSKYRAIEQMGDRPDLWERWASIFRSREDFQQKTGPDAAAAYFESKKDEMLKGTRVLWPELEDYATLMIIREREGRASFQAEKQNEPLDPDLCIFSEKNIHYWDDEADDVESLLDAVGRGGRFFGACDPSLGRRSGRGDYSGIVILYQPSGSNVKYVIVADLARRSPDKTIEQIIRYARMYEMTTFAVEGNNFQELMIEDLRGRAEKVGIRLPVRSITNRSNKQSRIAALEPEVTQGRIRLSRRHQLLLDQLRQFPLAAHDDGPDALEMAVDVCRNSFIALGTYGVFIGTLK